MATGFARAAYQTGRDAGAMINFPSGRSALRLALVVCRDAQAPRCTLGGGHVGGPAVSLSKRSQPSTLRRGNLIEERARERHERRDNTSEGCFSPNRVDGWDLFDKLTAGHDGKGGILTITLAVKAVAFSYT